MRQLGRNSSSKQGLDFSLITSIITGCINRRKEPLKMPPKEKDSTEGLSAKTGIPIFMPVMVLFALVSLRSSETHPKGV